MSVECKLSEWDSATPALHSSSSQPLVAAWGALEDALHPAFLGGSFPVEMSGSGCPCLVFQHPSSPGTRAKLTFPFIIVGQICPFTSATVWGLFREFYVCCWRQLCAEHPGWVDVSICENTLVKLAGNMQTLSFSLFALDLLSNKTAVHVCLGSQNPIFLLKHQYEWTSLPASFWKCLLLLPFQSLPSSVFHFRNRCSLIHTSWTSAWNQSFWADHQAPAFLEPSTTPMTWLGPQPSSPQPVSTESEIPFLLLAH